MKKITLVLCIVFVFTKTNAQTIINVPGDYSTIQAGINAATNGDTVLVQPGTYMENINFNGKTIVVASLFLITNDTSYITQTIIDGNSNYSTVSIENGEGQETLLVGFDIRNGLGTGDWPYVRGGGIHISNGATPTIKFCYIHDNFCTGDSNRGAGIYVNSIISTISNCKIYNNESAGGAAISIGNGSNGVVIDSCKIFNNISNHFSITSKSIVSIGYSSNITISRTLIHHNDGSGVRNFGSTNTFVYHCTISDNSIYGIYNLYSNSTFNILNSIIAFNSNTNVNNDTASAQLNAEYSNILNGTGEVWFNAGCIDIDPLFVNPSQNDYNLQSTSPCIDAADPSTSLDNDCTPPDMGAFYFNQGNPLSISASSEVDKGACNGAASVSVSGGTTPYSYQWSNGCADSSCFNLCAGTYNVTVTDGNGCIATISVVVDYNNVGVEETILSNAFVIYPNPNTGIFVIEMEITKSEDLEIKLLNVIGQVIYVEVLSKYSGTYQKTIDVGKQATGIYTLQLISDEGIINKKIIIE